MPYDPVRHRRRSIRLKGYDYAQAGAYFVTFCTHQRECLFGEVVGGEMVLSRYGQVAERCWRAIAVHFPHVELDVWVVMPNHLHGIVRIMGDAGRGEAFPPADLPRCGDTAVSDTVSAGRGRGNASPLPGPGFTTPAGVAPGSLGAIVGNFKSVVTRRVNRIRRTPGARVWQRGYYERIIRNAAAMDRIRAYIAANPARWGADRLNPLRAAPAAVDGPDPWEETT